jgi:nucleoside-diphosphate-sugar epimerase
MRVLVTGAGGFVGSQVVRALTRDGHQVVAVDRDPALLDRLAAAAPSASFAAIDLDDTEAVRALLRRAPPEGLIHLAWYAHPKDYLTSHANLASLTMTTALVEASLAAGCRKVVVGGSCVEYAAAARPLVEGDPVDPRTLYAACKSAAHQIARTLAEEAGAELAWARIFHIHGPNEAEGRLIPWVARQIRSGLPVPLTDGTQVRDHLHVADVAAALAALLAPGTSGVYNVCSGEPVTLRHVLETVGDILGGRSLLGFGSLPHRPTETMYLAGDSTRLRALGWTPRFGLRDGLADALGEKF